VNRLIFKSSFLTGGFLLAALGGFIGSRDPGRAQVRTRSVARSNDAAQSGSRTWGRLANPGYRDKTIKTTLFFAGRPLDGTGSENPNDPFFNGIGPSARVLDCYSVNPKYNPNLNWVDPDNPRSDANRLYVLREMADAGLNVVSMSTWGESWLRSTMDCSNIVSQEDCGPPCGNPKSDPNDCCRNPDGSKCIGRCSSGSRGRRSCRIGWYGAAPMQISTVAKDQLFDAAVKTPMLILPFIESRFDVDWDFDDEFPCANRNEFPCSSPQKLAPGLVSQIEDLINHYLKNPKHPEWANKWARVYDQKGNERYAVVIAHAASQKLDPNRHPESDRKFAAGFDAVANKIFQDTGGVRVGFLLDPMPPSPTSDFGCAAVDAFRLTSIYHDSFKPDGVTTGPELAQQESILGIHSYMPEGWVDVFPEPHAKVDQCFRMRWKEDFSYKWFHSGVPFLQDISAGYDGSILFQYRPPEGWGLTKWGYDAEWRAKLSQLVKDFGQNGIVYNAWNGYCEGLAGMETNENGTESKDWLRAVTNIYPNGFEGSPPIIPPGPLRPEVASFIYGILNDGQLRWYRHNGAASGLGLETPGAWQGPRPVGLGWGGFKQVFGGGGNVAYAITQDGRLLWYRHDGFNNGGDLTTWEGPKEVGHGWQHFREVFPGSDGVIYAITDDGTLKWYRHLGFADGSVSWDGPKDVGSGWADFKQVFAMGRGVIYAITNDGTLKWYQHAAYLEGRGLNSPGAWFGPKDFGGGWGDYVEVFPGGEGVIYAITNDGTLKWYRHDNFSGDGESPVPTSNAPTGDRRIHGRAGVQTEQRPLGTRQSGVLQVPGFSPQPGQLEGPRTVGNGWNGFRQVFALLPRTPDVVR
jgi:hypothetical protein